MRLLCLCKRRPQGRDIFTQPYGRFYHLPRLLAERGHEVHLLLLGYRREPAAYQREGNLHWHALPALPWGPFPYLAEASRMAAELRPDWVLGFSDTWYGILAGRLAKRCGACSLIDAYDNYESYIPWLRPLHSLWRRALTRADAVTAAGPQLAHFMSSHAGGRLVDVVPMSADPIFQPLDQYECRKRLGLPVDRPLIGYAGALHPNRGIDLLFDIYAGLRERFPRLGLVLSGRLSRGIALPDGVFWLGYRSAEEVPCVINSLDLMLVLNKPGGFGNYSYPAKLYEALACCIPVVASDVPGTAWTLEYRSEFLAQPGNAAEFAEKAAALLTGEEVRIHSRPYTWDASAALLEKIIESKPSPAFLIDRSALD